MHLKLSRNDLHSELKSSTFHLIENNILEEVIYDAARSHVTHLNQNLVFHCRNGKLWVVMYQMLTNIYRNRNVYNFFQLKSEGLTI